MKFISIYSIESGVLLRSVACQQELMAGQVGSGELGFVGVDKPEHRVLINSELFYCGPPPSPGLIFDINTKTWIDTRSNDDLWREIRGLRNQRLERSDWTQLPDASVDSTVWAEYRQKLRDITNQPDPRNIAWPAPPS
jgi:hypothetical protein